MKMLVKLRNVGIPQFCGKNAEILAFHQNAVKIMKWCTISLNAGKIVKWSTIQQNAGKNAGKNACESLVKIQVEWWNDGNARGVLIKCWWNAGKNTCKTLVAYQYSYTKSFRSFIFIGGNNWSASISVSKSTGKNASKDNALTSIPPKRWLRIMEWLAFHRNAARNDRITSTSSLMLVRLWMVSILMEMLAFQHLMQMG